VSGSRALREGDLFAGKYLVRRRLGHGSFGAVYLVEHARFPGQELALKLIQPPPARSREYLARFAQEVRIGCRLRSPHTVPVRDWDVDSDGWCYFTMDRVPGTPLDELIARDGRLPWRRALAIARQALLALAEAHEMGVVHRDVKPGNLLVEERPDGADHVRVLDFGIARIEGADVLTDSWMGTPYYMAPEQFRDPHGVDGRADLYAVAVVAYEAASGIRPWPGATAIEIYERKMARPLEPIGEARPEAGVPEAVDALLLRGAERDRARRFARAEEMIAAIDAALAGAPPGAEEAGEASGADAAPRSTPCRYDAETAIAPGGGFAAPAPAGGIFEGAAGTGAARPPAPAEDPAPPPAPALPLAPRDRLRLTIGPRTEVVLATPRLRLGACASAGPGKSEALARVAPPLEGATPLEDPFAEVLVYGRRLCLRDLSASGVRLDGSRPPRGALTPLPPRFRLEVPSAGLALLGRVITEEAGTDAPAALRLERAGGAIPLAWVWLLEAAALGPLDGAIPLPDEPDLGIALLAEGGAIHARGPESGGAAAPLLPGAVLRGRAAKALVHALAPGEPIGL
jgi:serine/threonine-protein kinase